MNPTFELSSSAKREEGVSVADASQLDSKLARFELKSSASCQHNFAPQTNKRGSTFKLIYSSLSASFSAACELFFVWLERSQSGLQPSFSHWNSGHSLDSLLHGNPIHLPSVIGWREVVWRQIWRHRAISTCYFCQKRMLWWDPRIIIGH